MAEYIEKEKTSLILREEAAAHYPTPYHVGLLAAARAIESIPAADVVPMSWVREHMSGDYISRKNAVENVLDQMRHSKSETAMRERLLNMVAADVRPVVRGKWELDSDPGEPWRYVCNICGEKTKDTVMGKPRAHFCPNCGAMMEES